MTAPRRAQVLPTEEKACIIGAGIAGLTAAKAPKDRDIPYDQLEREGSLGGLWRCGHARSSAYETLHIISSTYNMELAAFPMRLTSRTTGTTLTSSNTSRTGGHL